MASGWDVYYILFLAALLALGFPLVLAGISLIISPRSRNTGKAGDKSAPAQAPAPAMSAELTAHKRINTRFFLAANVAIVLIVLALALIPCVSVLKSLESSGNPASLIRGLVAILTIAGFLSLGLFYSARKGDLSWLKTYRETDE